MPVGVLALAIGERAIGLWLLSGRAPRKGAASTALHLVGTSSPCVIFPGERFARVPLGLTLLGQYLLKNVVLLGAMVLLATPRSEAELPLILPAFLRLAQAHLVAPSVAFFDDTRERAFALRALSRPGERSSRGETGSHLGMRSAPERRAKARALREQGGVP